MFFALIYFKDTGYIDSIVGVSFEADLDKMIETAATTDPDKAYLKVEGYQNDKLGKYVKDGVVIEPLENTTKFNEETRVLSVLPEGAVVTVNGEAIEYEGSSVVLSLDSGEDLYLIDVSARFTPKKTFIYKSEAEKKKVRKREAESEINRLSDIADKIIAPLQDAVDFEISTEEEAASLKAWKKYRILLSRVPKQAGYPDEIDWPVAPDDDGGDDA